MADGCWKIRYPSRRLAQGQLRSFKQRHQRHTQALQAYRCPHCAGWHLGNKDREVSAAIAGLRRQQQEKRERRQHDGDA